MKKVFIAFAFHYDSDFAKQVEQLLRSHQVIADTGERLGGEALTPAVKKKIDEADALIALLTRREAIEDKKYTTHQWVQTELGYARNKKKRAIALIEHGVSVPGLHAENEYIPFDRQNPVPAFLALSDTIGQWKEEAGRKIKAMMLPLALTSIVRRQNKPVKCQYRFYKDGEYTKWRPGKLVNEVGGTFVDMVGVHDQHTIQLKVVVQKTIWQSLASPQWVPIKLRR